jgi:COP9 signalosome complex subunit 4
MILDSKRKFNVAAWEFFRLSNNADLDSESQIL